MAVTALSSVSPVATTALDGFASRAATAVHEGEGQDFASVLGGMIANVNNDLKKAEALSIGAMRGDGAVDVQEVVGAVMAAEQSLRMAVAVRDKIVAAYLDLSRMQI
ncbi:MAG: flagellar hook-basal body complex protein FliE [Alphaproteobacteria bacterium]|nr:MAG: flagellar hook-basal body complex protein FliE [Alphaproteobacteria bacterium]